MKIIMIEITENIDQKIRLKIRNKKIMILIIRIIKIMLTMILLTKDKNPLNQGEKKFDENNTISSRVAGLMDYSCKNSGF